MWQFSKQGLLITLFSVLMCASSVAKADDCISKAASCIVNSAKAGYFGVSAVSEVLAFTVLHPDCVAAIVAQDYISLTTITTVSGLAATGVIGSSENSCKQDLYGKYASKIAANLALVVPNKSLQDIASNAMTSGIESAMSAVPFPGALPTVGLQLTCGCAIANTGADMIEKIKKTAQYTAAAAKSCTGTMSCLGGTVVSAIKGTGEVFYQTGKCIGSLNDCGENAPMAEASYYQAYWAKDLNQFVEALMSDGKLTVSNGVGYVKAISPAQFISDTWHECEDYYLNHKYSGGTLSTGDHAQRACDGMRDKFTADANATRGVRMDNEVFPKVAATLTTSYLNDCEIPKTSKSNTSDGSITIDDTNSGANTYGSDQLTHRAECIAAIQSVIGKSPDGTVMAQPDSVLWEVKNTYKANNFDIKTTFNKLMVSGSKYDIKIKEIAKLKKAQIAVGGLINQKTVLINAAYAKIGNEKWNEYKGKCPASAHLFNALNDTARSICLNKTASYIGISVLSKNDVIKDDDVGSIDFNHWATVPVVYSAALKSFEQANDANQTLAEARVQLSFATHQADLDSIATDSIKTAKEKLQPIRQKQEQDYQAKLSMYTQEYSNALECKLPLKEAMTHTCKYAQSAVDEMFNAWHTSYLNFVQQKDTLDKKIGDQNLPFTGSSIADSDFLKLLSDIDKATKRSVQLYKIAKDKSGAVIKESKNYSADIAADAKKNPGKSPVLDALKERQAQTSAKDGLGKPIGNTTNGLGNQFPDVGDKVGIGNTVAIIPQANSAPTADKPKIRGMRAAPSMTAATTPNQLPQAKVLPKSPTLGDAQQAIQEQSDSMTLNQQPPIGAGVAINAKPSVASTLPSTSNAATTVAVEMPKPSTTIGTSKEISAPSTVGIGGPANVATPAPSNNRRTATIDSPPAPASTPSPLVKDTTQILVAPAKPSEPPFDRASYQHMAKQSLGNKWLNLCKNNACKSEINNLINDRINEVLKALDSGQDLRVKSIHDAIESRMDVKYNPLMQASVNASIPRSIENTPPKYTMPIKPIKKLNL